MIGRRLRTRTLPNQRAEANVSCNVLNGMTGLGMPFLAQCLAITPVNSTVGGGPEVIHRLGVNFADSCALCRTLGPSR